MNFDHVEVVIDQLISKFRLQEGDFDREVLADNVGSALKHIGADRGFTTKTAQIKIKNYLGKLPAGLESIVEISPNIPYKEIGGFIEVDTPDDSTLTLVYQSMLLDERGLPMVPDNAAVREAIIWYMARDLALGGLIRTISWQQAEQEWQWRCGSARAELNAGAMNKHAMRNIYDNYTSLAPTHGVKNERTLDRTKNLTR